MFNRFSTGARAVVRSAVEEAERRGDRRVGTEHLLLGLLQDPRSAATRALGISLGAARDALREMDNEALAAVGVDASTIAPVTLPRSGGRRPFTSAAKSALKRTLREAVQSKHRTMEPTHLLLALLGGERPDPVAGLLARLDVDPAVVRARLRRAA